MRILHLKRKERKLLNQDIFLSETAINKTQIKMKLLNIVGGEC